MLRKKKIITKRTARKRKACLPGRQGQSTVEYIILVAAVVAVILLFAGSGDSPFRKAFNKALISGTNGMENMAWRLEGSRPLGK